MKTPDRYIPVTTRKLLQSALPAAKRATVTTLRPKHSAYSAHWLMASNKPIRMPTVVPRQLSADWDGERLRCWPALTTAQAEVRVAKVMCAVLGCFLAVVAQALVLS